MMNLFKYLTLLSSALLPLQAMEGLDASGKLNSPDSLTSSRIILEPVQQEQINKYYAEKYFLPIVKDLDLDNPQVFKSYESFVAAPASITGYKKNMDWNTCWKKFWEPMAKIERSLFRPKAYNVVDIIKEMDVLDSELLNQVQSVIPQPVQMDAEDKPKSDHQSIQKMALTLPEMPLTLSVTTPKEVTFVSDNVSLPFENDSTNDVADHLQFKGMDSSFLTKSVHDILEKPVETKPNHSKEYKARLEKEKADNVIRTANMQKDTFRIESELRNSQDYYRKNYPKSIFGSLPKDKEDQMIESAIFLIKSGKILTNGDALKKALELIDAPKEEVVEQKPEPVQEEKQIEASKGKTSSVSSLSKEVDPHIQVNTSILTTFYLNHERLVHDYNNVLDEIVELKAYREETSPRLKDALWKIELLKEQAMIKKEKNAKRNLKFIDLLTSKENDSLSKEDLIKKLIALFKESK